MVAIPRNLPEPIMNFCIDSNTSPEILIQKLKENIPFLIEFFKAAAIDKEWRANNKPMMKNIKNFLAEFSLNGMTLRQAREIHEVAKMHLSPKSRFVQNNIKLICTWAEKSIFEGIDLQVARIKETQMNKVVLSAASKTLAGQLNSQLMIESQSGNCTFRMPYRQFEPLQRYMETGDCSGFRNLPDDEIGLYINDFFEIESLPEDLLKDLIENLDIVKPEYIEHVLRLLNNTRQEEKLLSKAIPTKHWATLFLLIRASTVLDQPRLLTYLVKNIQRQVPGTVLTCSQANKIELGITSEKIDFQALAGFLKALYENDNTFELHLKFQFRSSNVMDLLKSLPFTYSVDFSKLSSDCMFSARDGMQYLTDLRKLRTKESTLIKYLAYINCNKLEEYSAINAYFSIEELNMLAIKCPNLKELRFEDCGICDENFEKMQGFNLRSLTVISNLHIFKKSHILDLINPNLEDLYIANLPAVDRNAGAPRTLRPEGLAKISEKCKNLKSFGLVEFGSEFTDRDIQAFLKENKQLKAITLYGGNEQNLTADLLPSLFECENLEKMDVLLNTKVDPAEEELIEPFDSDIEWENEGINEFAVNALSLTNEKIISFPKLEHLTSFNTGTTLHRRVQGRFSEPYRLELFLPLDGVIEKMPNTESITVWPDMRLANLANLKQLTDIDFKREVNDEDLDTVLSGCFGLKHLNVSNGNLTNVAIEVLTTECPNLEHLCLNGHHVQIDEVGIRTLAKFRNLKSLSLVVHTPDVFISRLHTPKEEGVCRELFELCPLLEIIALKMSTTFQGIPIMREHEIYP